MQRQTSESMALGCLRHAAGVLVVLLVCGPSLIHSSQLREQRSRGEPHARRGWALLAPRRLAAAGHKQLQTFQHARRLAEALATEFNASYRAAEWEVASQKWSSLKQHWEAPEPDWVAHYFSSPPEVRRDMFFSHWCGRKVGHCSGKGGCSSGMLSPGPPLPRSSFTPLSGSAARTHHKQRVLGCHGLGCLLQPGCHCHPPPTPTAVCATCWASVLAGGCVRQDAPGWLTVTHPLALSPSLLQVTASMPWSRWRA